MLTDLAVPPANNLANLKGDRAGQFGIRVSDQWRICVDRTGNGADNAELTDFQCGGGRHDYDLYTPTCMRQSIPVKFWCMHTPAPMGIS